MRQSLSVYSKQISTTSELQILKGTFKHIILASLRLLLGKAMQVKCLRDTNSRCLLCRSTNFQIAWGEA